MYIQLSCVICDADATNRAELAAFLGQYGVNVQAQLPSIDGLAAYLGRSEMPQMVVANLDPAPAESLRKISHLPRTFPNVSFFAMSQVLDPNLLMEAMSTGIREFIPLPIPEVRFAAALERVAQAYGMGKRAKVIHVIPTQGGCGSTTIACNTAAALAGGGEKACLLDLDLVKGGVAGMFDVSPRYTIADVMQSTDALDKQVLDNALTVHRKSNLSILARPELPEDTQRVTREGVGRLFSILGRMFDHVVVDSQMSVDPVYSTLVQAADVNVVVMQLNVPSAKNAERFVGAMRRMGIEASKIRIVVSRFVKKGWDIEPGEVERALGLKICWMVPNDFKNAIAAVNYGEPVVLRAPRSDISQSLLGFAQSLKSRDAQVKQAA